MATEATRLKFEVLREINRPRITRFSIPSVAPATTSVVYSLNVETHEGKIQVLRVSSDTGVNYTVSFRTHETAGDYSVDEILRVEQIDEKGYQEVNLGISYSNEDDEVNPDTSVPFYEGELPVLYLKVTNDDGLAATGTIIVELVIESQD